MKTCKYQKSRRGGRPRHPAVPPPQDTVENISATSEQHQRSQLDKISATASLPLGSNSSDTGTAVISSQSDSNSFVNVSIVDSIVLGGTYLTQGQIDQLLIKYYVCFHVAHPCVLPRWSLLLRLTSEPVASDTLLPVLLYIGSIFTDVVDSGPLAEAASRAVSAARLRPGPLDPYYIQALLLYAIAVYWCNEPRRGRDLLNEVICGALTLEMQRMEFASRYGQGDPVLQESWRRTWWTIYITDAHIAGSTHSFPTQSGAVEITTGLPCEEHKYESGDISPPATLRSYGVREFSDMEFSSFAELVGLTQGINRALATQRIGNIENAKVMAETADNTMMAWCSLLPASKKKIIRDDGSVDEHLFKANILMHAYIVDLHRQLSTLKYFPIESVSKCVPPPPPDSNDAIKEEAHIHTAKVLFSIEKLSSLLTLPTRFSEHTPFIICTITLMTIAHLSACRYIFKEPRISLEREKIRLKMGVLKMLGELWPSGKREYHDMGIIAREMLAIEDEEVEIPEMTGLVPPDALALNFDFDIDWNCDSAASSNTVGFMTDAI
ncbi:DNA binding [Ascochyta rabiei]|uniref:DNA binding n=2 Tax=Didymella rabiei TaxID=5454 RepID=A0A163JTN4_DIDRA|nr:DNA binding [Ascochyta rabiei]